jgi:hypothetical protein
MVAPPTGTPPSAAPLKRDVDPAPTRGDHARKAGTAHVRGDKGTPVSRPVKSGLIDLTPADTYWEKHTSPASSRIASRTADTVRVSTPTSGQVSDKANGPTIDNSTPIEKQIDQLKKKLRIPAGRDLQTEINNRLGRLVSGDKSTDKAINSRIAELENARRHKGHFERLGPNNKIEQLRYLKELRTLVNKADGLKIWSKELTDEIATLKSKAADTHLPRAQRDNFSARAKTKSDQLAAIDETLYGHREPKDEEALVASSNRMDELSHSFAHPDKHFVKAQDLREQLTGMQKEFGTFAKLSREIYGTAKGAEGAEVYLANKRHTLRHAYRFV